MTVVMTKNLEDLRLEELPLRETLNLLNLRQKQNELFAHLLRVNLKVITKAEDKRRGEALKRKLVIKNRVIIQIQTTWLRSIGPTMKLKLKKSVRLSNESLNTGWEKEVPLVWPQLLMRSNSMVTPTMKMQKKKRCSFWSNGKVGLICITLGRPKNHSKTSKQKGSRN